VGAGLGFRVGLRLGDQVATSARGVIIWQRGQNSAQHRMQLKTSFSIKIRNVFGQNNFFANSQKMCYIIVDLIVVSLWLLKSA